MAKKTTTTPTSTVDIIKDPVTGNQYSRDTSVAGSTYSPYTAPGATPTTTKKDSTKTTTQPTVGSYDTTGSDSMQTQNDFLANYGLSSSEEDKIRNDTLARWQDQINATKASYATLLKEQQALGVGRLGETTAVQARRGMLGSDMGAGLTEGVRGLNLSKEQGVLESQNTAIANIMAQANADAQAEINAKRAAKSGGYTAYTNYQNTFKDEQKKKYNNMVSSFLLSNIDPSTMDKLELNKIAKIYGTTTQDIINDYLVAKDTKAKEDAKAAKDGYMSVSEGSTVIDPTTGKVIYRAPKTYAPKDGTGSGSYDTLAEFPPDIQSAAQSILDGKSKLNEYPSAKRLQINAAMSKVYTAEGGNELAQAAYDAVKDLEAHPGKSGAVGAKGLSSWFGLKENPIEGTAAAGFKSKLGQVLANIKLVNIKYLKGTGALSDAEGRTLENAGTSLTTASSEEEFNKELANIKAALEKANNLVGEPQSQNSTVKTLADYQAEFPSATPEELRALMAEEQGQ